jgi:arylformamidase
LPPGIQRLLLRTRNSLEWANGRTEFTPDFAALTPAAAKWMVERGIRLLAVDYLSVQRFSDRTPATHVTLLEAGVVIVEGVDLHQVPEGSYQLICLPLRLKAAEAAPARAVLIKE